MFHVETYLMEPFEFITSVSESSHSVNIEGILSLADGGDSLLQLCDMYLLVGPFTIVWDRKFTITGAYYRNMMLLHYKLGKIKYLPSVSSHVWPAPLCWGCGKLEVDHWERTVGTSQTLAAAGCGETHCGWLALQTEAINHFATSYNDWFNLHPL